MLSEDDKQKAISAGWRVLLEERADGLSYWQLVSPDGQYESGYYPTEEEAWNLPALGARLRQRPAQKTTSDTMSAMILILF